jgi:solute carrier family 35 protein E3
MRIPRILLRNRHHTQVRSNFTGLVVGGVATVTSAMYGIWAGAKQREYGVDGLQLLHQCSPAAVVLLGVFVPVLEPLGWGELYNPDTIYGYQYTSDAVAMIVLSALMGILVTCSVFLFIGASSPLTYSVVGHLKTVFIMAGGFMFFGDSLSGIKLVGLGLAMLGIVSYSNAQMKR